MSVLMASRSPVRRQAYSRRAAAAAELMKKPRRDSGSNWRARAFDIGCELGLCGHRINLPFQALTNRGAH